MKESLSLRFLYHTVPGRCVLRVLISPGISKVVGSFLNSRFSKNFIPGFMKKNHITLEGIDVPEGGFACFNDFFYRKRKQVVFDEQPGHFCSPCDSLLTCIEMRAGTVLDVKNSEYSVKDLLQDDVLAEEFKEGYALVFRLTPSHYHRYSYQADGVRKLRRRIDGRLHCVRPIALHQYPVFAQNSREYEVIDTVEFGRIIQMEVGALFVGKITNLNNPEGELPVKKGEEKGYFEFGGSTIIVLTKNKNFSLRPEVAARVNEDGEIPVIVGEYIADC